MLIRNNFLKCNKFVSLPNISRKFFDLHEYQSKTLFREKGLKVQNGGLASTAEEAFTLANSLKGELILKAQVHAGGRGKGHLTSGLKGGVKICNSANQIKDFASQMIGYNLITHQTPKAGLPVKSVLVLESVDIKRQIYLAIVLDRQHGGPVIISSTEGGVDIEEVAASTPEKIKVTPVDIKKGLTKEQAETVVTSLGLTGKQIEQGVDQLKKLYDLFMETDATQIEINPWAVDNNGELFLVDAKVNIDESAFFRQQRILDLVKDGNASSEIDKYEEEAKKFGLNYIGLNGTIGCLVNGAGLAMSTMDIITLKGGEPANFLDVGGGASVEQVTAAFKILCSQPKVNCILVNIFGGIMRCGVIAEGIINAVKIVGVKVPIVVRLTGTNATEGKAILEKYREEKGFNFITADNLDEAATRAVEQTKI